MKRIILLGFIVSLGVSALSQKVEVYVKEHIPNKSAIPYVHIREADVLWSKTVWRMIDLREKQNHALYYPKRPIGVSDHKRRNLTNLLLKGIQEKTITPYTTNDPLNEFKVRMTDQEINRKWGDSSTVLNPDLIATDDIKKILVKELWYFDKQHSVMKVQIIGLSPILVYPQLDQYGTPTGILIKEQAFWIYYPEARQLLSEHEIFNRNNDAQRISFDDFFQQRLFHGIIYGESNVYDNRFVVQYTTGIETLYEAERIRNNIFTIEHDMWEY